MSRPGDELAELLWDDGPALRRTPHFTPPAPFQPFTCSAAGSSRAHELGKRRGAAGPMDDDVGLPVHDGDDDDAVPWLHCPVIDDGDSDTAPLPPEYCAGLMSGYSGLHTVPVPPASGIERPSSNGRAAVPTARAVPSETAAAQPQPSAAGGGGGGEGIMNFTFFSRPLQRPQASASPSHPVEPTAMQTAASRLRSTPLFSEQRMAWLQPPPKAPRATAVAPAPPQAPSATDHHHRHAEAAATVTQHRLQPDPRAPDAAAAVTTSSVCSGNGDRAQAKRSSHQPSAECSVSQDEDVDDEGGAMRRSAARGTKRTRTAEVHNLSERRRRDRINEKMRALQELIPNCNKIDKASMLEEAIEYLKTLQLQVQMMSMGTGLCVPAMQYMQMPPMAHFPHLGMGLGFGMGAAAFDMLPRLAGAQFPCPVIPGAPPMAMPPASMFGLPGQAMPSPAMFTHMAGTAPVEQMEAAAPAARGASAGEHPSVPVTTQGEQTP